MTIERPDWNESPRLDLRQGPASARLRSVAMVGAVVVALAWVLGGDWLRSTIAGSSSVAPTLAFDIDREMVPGHEEALPVLEHPAPPGVTGSELAPGQDRTGGAALDKDRDWWESAEFRSGQGFVTDPYGAWRAANPYRSTDFLNRYVSVIDGARTTWRPPPCNCPRLTLWMYGGSTTFGLNQRGGHTIASELARVAHENGIWLDVSNRGRNGHLHWIEAELFALDLTVDDPPDIAVFYDGWNDRWAYGNGKLTNDVPAPVDPSLIDLWDSSGRPSPPVPRGPDGSRLIGREQPTLSLRSIAQNIVQQYDRTRTLSAATARSYGVLDRYFWQPSRYSRDLVLEEAHFDTDTENRMRTEDQLMTEFLPNDVVDLTDALDGNHDPLFTDDIHHNEAGSRLIAEAIFADLEPDLRRLLRGH